MKNKHAQAPWRYGLVQLAVDPNAAELTFETIKDYYEIRGGCGIYQGFEFGNGDADEGFGLSGYISEANAKLIAAAPELLSMLQHAVELMEELGVGEHDRNIYKQVIQKATK